jgi:hypothetical protein
MRTARSSYHGRIDTQVKIYGYRIEPLLQTPADRAVGGGTRQPICFAAVAAQRGIGDRSIR